MQKDTIQQWLVKAHVLKFLLLMITMAAAERLSAQATNNKLHKISGTVTDSTGAPLAFVTVYLDQARYGTTTDKHGVFQIDNVPDGNYTLFIQAVGFQTLSKKIALSDENLKHQNFVLHEKTTNLDEVVISTPSETDFQLQSAKSITIINTQAFANRAATTADILNAAPGIRVRQQGGLGSDANISVQGVAGKQIKFFLNGVPLDAFGQGLGINAIPLNIIDRIEIHKGFVPIGFGGDALGGAVNLVSNTKPGSYLDFAYSVGSFNTHNAHISSRYARKDYHISLTAFRNYSDNDYPVRVGITNQYGNPEPHTVRRFHNAYVNRMIAFDAGIHNKRFADHLSFQVGASGVSDDKQHGTTMEVPFGKVNLREDAYSISLLYKKSLGEKLEIDLFSAFSYLNRNFTDTSRNIYNWRSEVIGRSQFGGESSYSGNLLTLHTSNFLNRINLTYHWNAETEIKLSYFSGMLDRTGKDPVAAVYYKKDIFANPTTLNKNIAALSVERSLFHERLSSITFFKFFSYYSIGSNLATEANSLSNSTSRIGYGQAFRYKLSEAGLLKFSYEQSTRMPDEIELFGLGNIVLPNPLLSPERSHNINLGGSFRTSSKRLNLESNLFYRIVDDIIYQRLITPLSSQYQNLLKVQVAGIEASADFKITKAFRFTANATFQDLRNKKVSGDLTKRYVGAQLPNIPFLFGSTRLQYDKTSLFNHRDKIEAWWGLNYVHWFYLYWSIDGKKGTKRIIPDQWAQQAGLSYHFKQDKLVATVEVNNLLDQRLYDNYNVQKPGRSFSLKLRFFLNNNN